jgi:hypothetical protein
MYIEFEILIPLGSNLERMMAGCTFANNYVIFTGF